MTKEHIFLKKISDFLKSLCKQRKLKKEKNVLIEEIWLGIGK
jgi:hypothetical protein